MRKDLYVYTDKGAVFRTVPAVQGGGCRLGCLSPSVTSVTDGTLGSCPINLSDLSVVPILPQPPCPRPRLSGALPSSPSPWTKPVRVALNRGRKGTCGRRVSRLKFSGREVIEFRRRCTDRRTASWVRQVIRSRLGDPRFGSVAGGSEVCRGTLSRDRIDRDRIVPSPTLRSADSHPTSVHSRTQGPSPQTPRPAGWNHTNAVSFVTSARGCGRVSDTANVAVRHLVNAGCFGFTVAVTSPRCVLGKCVGTRVCPAVSGQYDVPVSPPVPSTGGRSTEVPDRGLVDGVGEELTNE